MFLNNEKIFILMSLVILLSSCAKIEYTNPLDPKSPDYVGPDSAGDHDTDGVANIYDEDSPLFRQDKDYPVIELLGDNPAILRFKQSEEAKFNEKIKELEKAFRCYDPSDKSVGNDDVNVEVNVGFFEGDNQNIKYSVEDSSGNYTRVIRTVVVIILPEDDTIPPSITPASSDTVEIEYGKEDIAYLNYVYISDNDLSIFVLGENVTLEGEVDTKKEGIYKVTYTAVDSSGNSSSYTLYFNVVGGHSNPAIINVYYDGRLLSDDFVFKDTLPDVSFDPSLFSSKVIEYVNGSPVEVGEAEFECDYEPNKEGRFIANFYILGTSPDTLRKEFLIIIYDAIEEECDTAITLELKGDQTVTVEVGKKYEEPGFTATRTAPNRKDVTNQVKVNPESIDTKKQGTFTITYEISACGNKIIKTRTVKVVKTDSKDTEPPEITLRHSKDQDTVTVGTRYTRDYKSKDVGNTAKDDVDGQINWASVKVDTSGFNTTGAGKPCSLVYTVKDKAGNEGRAVRKITVIAGPDVNDLLQKYGVPSKSSLPMMQNSTFTRVTVEGTGGPSTSTTSNIKQLKINFDNSQYGSLWEFAIELKSGNPNHIDLKEKAIQTFKQNEPEMNLTGTGISGFDNEYYVTYTDKKFIWVEKSGKFAIIWEQ